MWRSVRRAVYATKNTQRVPSVATLSVPTPSTSKGTYTQNKVNLQSKNDVFALTALHHQKSNTKNRNKVLAQQVGTPKALCCA